MLTIHCSGTPYEIGLQHGTQAREAVGRCIDFYAKQFQFACKMDWPRVRQLAATFEPILQRQWPTYLDEMAGIAAGAQRELVDIIAINVRTEITFGMFQDGCTALSWRTEDASFLAQNWDWMEEQKQNLVLLTIEQPATDLPTIKMVTEAGLMGKIGFNAAGVGVCLNAIRAAGMDPSRLPCHLGLRMVLESRSCREAMARLKRYGIASSCHMLVADAEGGVGLEWSAVDLRKLSMDARGRVLHTNHYVVEHAGVEDSRWLKDSSFRLTRIEELCNVISVGQPDGNTIASLFIDEDNYPRSICRAQRDDNMTATLFNIVMDLSRKHATVKLGRPNQPEELVELQL